MKSKIKGFLFVFAVFMCGISLVFGQEKDAPKSTNKGLETIEIIQDFQNQNQDIYTQVPANVEFFGKKIPFDIYGVWDDVWEWIKFFMSSRHHWRMELYHGISKDFFPFVEPIFLEERIPSDMKFVSIGESEMNPNAVSHKNAVGIWQFIKSTGQKNGLTINKSVDERRELIASTRAACKEMRSNFERFNQSIKDTAECWWLALAAYNAGPGAISNALKADGENSYFLLSSIPRETERYIPLMVAIKMILNNPEWYGFSDNTVYNGPKTEFVRMKFSSFSSWKSILKQLKEDGHKNLSLKELRRANSYIADKNGVPKGEYILRIPIR